MAAARTSQCARPDPLLRPAGLLGSNNGSLRLVMGSPPPEGCRHRPRAPAPGPAQAAHEP